MKEIYGRIQTQDLEIVDRPKAEAVIVNPWKVPPKRLSSSEYSTTRSEESGTDSELSSKAVRAYEGAVFAGQGLSFAPTNRFLTVL